MKQQRFKNEILTERKCINSILRFYHAALPSEVINGLKWYNEAHEYCKELASRFNISLQQAAGIIAVFSPQAGWIENKRYAVSFLINPKNRLRSLVQDIKAKKIIKLKSEDQIYHALTVNDAAWKTKAFFLNILNPDINTDVTIDRHAIACCIQSTDNVYALDKTYAQPTLQQYNFFQSCFIQAAKQLDILPHELQAITWLAYRRIRELPKHEDKNHWQPFTTEIF